jgi:membrane-associated protease RseP (regulator of RpoE activity)
MTYALGVTIFAVGILFSVCLHEAGHLLTAKRFGMKATHYFAGFGPTLWSVKRGETEYGIKAIPAGGFVKIVGMTPLEDVDPADKDRAFWRYPLWQRTIVLVAGSATHFALAIVIFYFAAITTGLPNPAAMSFEPTSAKPVIGRVSDCVVQKNDVDKSGVLRACRGSDPAGPAKAAGLRHGDRVVSIGATRVPTYGDLVNAVRASPPGPTEVVFVRDGVRHTTTVDLVSTQRPPVGKGKRELATVAAMGVQVRYPRPINHSSAIGGIKGATDYTGTTITGTFKALGAFPAKIPNLIDSIGGKERDTNGPISVVSASRVGGEAVQLGKPIIFLVLLGGLNVFIGVFNLFPLLPLDGGHVAIAWYERARSWFAARRGKADPGRVDYNKLLPLTYVVVLIFGGLTLLTLTAHIVNPISVSP